MVDEEDIIKIGKEIIPNIYDDGAKPAIKEMGNFIARPLKLINTLFQPLDVWLLNKEYNLEKTKTCCGKWVSESCTICCFACYCCTLIFYG